MSRAERAAGSSRAPRPAKTGVNALLVPVHAPTSCGPASRASSRGETLQLLDWDKRRRRWETSRSSGPCCSVYCSPAPRFRWRLTRGTSSPQPASCRFMQDVARAPWSHSRSATCCCGLLCARRRYRSDRDHRPDRSVHSDRGKISPAHTANSCPARGGQLCRADRDLRRARLDRKLNGRPSLTRSCLPVAGSSHLEAL